MPIEGHMYPGAKWGRASGQTLHARVTVGASGAVSSQSARKLSRMVVTRSGAGTYVCTFSKKVGEVLDGCLTVLVGSYTAASDGIWAHPIARTTSTITFQVRRADGVAADPISGATLLIRIDTAESTAR